MKKKLAGALAVIFMLVGLVGCGSKEEEKSNEKDNGKVEETKNSEKNEQKYTVEIDGEKYNFPMSYEEFKSHGWVYYQPEKDDVSSWNAGLAPNILGSKMFYTKGNMECVEFMFYNPSESSAKYDQCKVVGVSVDYGQTIERKDAENFIKVPNGSIVINDKIKIGESTKDDVYKLLGDDMSLRNRENKDYSQLNVWIYFFDEKDKESVNRALILTFDEKDICTELTYANIGEK